MKKNNKILMILATVATAAASLVATSACYWSFYQPEEPKSLREE
nr:cyclic lactone autoinducer peptide [Clostridium chrysemydis]